MLHAVYARTTGVAIKWKGCNGTAEMFSVWQRRIRDLDEPPYIEGWCIRIGIHRT